MLKCQKITELASKQLDTDIKIWQKIELTLHVWMCKTCHSYIKQLGFIQKLAANIDKHKENINLSDEARQRIQQTFNHAQNYDS